ncbi:GNAT family N-acetyltransferase [Subsaxibacter sp. CAU 1640]|uniref:GNAT family N-acetyltransferase n=1 Tax=Subsaxibacter sp. CAU 1640 TaxID=2933271 RepID=UPI0020048CA9|nr:GNAT family N-acetyltransferase [Subsaxibacter sp. CAU 1640]MCK7589286.1 GNAT family N-acetyltransferase [Subsaxibacter sp. CAU 1640]
MIAKITLEDAPFILELLNTPNWIKFIGDRNVKTLEEAEIYLQNGILKSYENFGFGFYKLLLKSEDNKIIGTSGLIKREQLEHVDIGFAFLPEYEGKGFGYESSVAIMDLAKNKFNLKKLLAITLENNLNSIKLLEKLGLKYEKKIKPFEDDDELLLFAKELDSEKTTL